MKISYQKFLISKFITQKCIKQCYYCTYYTTTVCMYCMWCDCFITNTLYAYKHYPTCDPNHLPSLSLQLCSGEVVHISPLSLSTALLCRPAPGTSKPHPSTRTGSAHQPFLLLYSSALPTCSRNQQAPSQHQDR